MLEAVCYNIIIHGATVTELKRKASKIANMYYNTFDHMYIAHGDILVHFMRTNIKAPNNTIKRGEWR
jgi:hypothetical protein